MLLGTLIPVVQNILAVVNRLVLDTARASRSTALVGSSQSTVDNVIAIALNLLLAAYFYRILQSDRKVSTDQTNLTDIKRIYRYVWMIYGLAMTIIGIYGLIEFVFRQAATIDANSVSGLVNPLALLILGAPIWVYAWLSIQKSISDLQERYSLWRVVLFYMINLGFAATVFGSVIAFISRYFEALLVLPKPDLSLLTDLRPITALLVPFLVLCIYYQKHFFADIESRTDILAKQGMYRLYRYILADSSAWQARSSP